jgi:glyoxylase-like metal-dependent hydrolase (beta-lactamase superfamily II)
MQLIDSGDTFARYRLGDLTVIALRDGHVDMPASTLRRQDGLPFGADLPGQVQLVDGQLRLSVNAYLVIDKGNHILIDTGSGNAWESTMGFLPGALADAGIAPQDIPIVALTHTHMDHVYGLVSPDGAETFPRLARLLVPHQEIAPFDTRRELTRFRARCVTFGDGFALSDRITVVQALGHSEGHSAFEVSSGGKTLLIWGDIVHVPSIQFSRPELVWEHDDDQGQARASRHRLLDRAAQSEVWIAGAHLDFPGVGSVARADSAYSFSPV